MPATSNPPAEPTFFATPAEFRAWLQAHHGSETELLLGFWKRGSGKPSITWPESVDQALCFGWIDGVRRSLGDEAYTIRFTPRKRGSTWSAVNVARVAELARDGLMHPAGQRAFDARVEARTAIYSYEQRETAALDAEAEARFRAVPGAWDFYQAQAPWYRRTSAWWVISARKPETRDKRLATLIDDSAHGRRLAQLDR